MRFNQPRLLVGREQDHARFLRQCKEQNTQYCQGNENLQQCEATSLDIPVHPCREFSSAALWRDVCCTAVWLLEVVGRLARGKVDDIVGVWCAVQPRLPSHPVRDRVIRARRVAADAKSADHFATGIEGDTTTECDDSTRN